MKKSIIPLLVAILLIPSLAFSSTLLFSDNYSTLHTAGTHNLSGSLSVSSNQLNYNDLENGQTYRYERSLLTTLAANDKWRAEFKFRVNSHTSINYGAQIFILNSHSGVHMNNQTSGSSISVWMGDLLGSNTDLFLFIRGKDGSTFHAASSKIYIDKNTTYYARVERLDIDLFILALYSHEDRLPSQLIEKVCYVPDNNQIGSFTTLQHSVTSSTTPRFCNGFIADTKIWDDPKECCECGLEPTFTVDEGPCPTEFTYSVDFCDETYYMGSVMDYDDGNHEFTGSSSGMLYYEYPAHLPYYPELTSFAYYYDYQTQQYTCCTETYSYPEPIMPAIGCSHENNVLEFQAGDGCDATAQLTLLGSDPNFMSIQIQHTSIITPRSLFLGAVVEYGDGNVAHLVDLNQILIHSYWNPGRYTVKLTLFTMQFFGSSWQCCSDEYTLIADFRIGLPGFRTSKGFDQIEGGLAEEDYNFAVYPNPFNDQLNISFESESSEVMVFNAIGEMVQRVNTIGKSKLELDLSDQPSGIYFIKVRTGEEIQVRKIVKE